MSRKTSLGLTMLLVFVLAFSAAVITYSPAKADPPPEGCCILVYQCQPYAHVGYGILNDFDVCIKDPNPSQSGCWPPDLCDPT